MEFIYIEDETNLGIILKDIEKLNNNSRVSIDTETYGLDARIYGLRLVQLKISNTIYILNIEKLNKKYLKYILELLVDKDSLFILQNAKFDLKFLYFYGEVLLHKIYDTMVAESIIAGCKVKYPSLDYLLMKYLNVTVDKNIRLNFIDSDITNEMLIYSALDVKYLEDIMTLQLEKISELKLENTLNLEMRVVPATAMMEWNGIYLDENKWTELAKYSENEVIESTKKIKDSIWERVNKDYKNSYEFIISFDIRITTKKLKAELESIEDVNHIKTWWYENFNVNSRNNMIAALDKLGIKLPNFQAGTLEEFKDKDTIVASILNMKTWEKKASTYGIKFLENIHPVTGKVHSEFNQNGAETGRYASSKPNLQNIPKDSEEDRILWRDCFNPQPDFVYILSDYSQQEYRIIAQVTGEDTIINAYLNDVDLHANTASIVFNIPIEKITPEQRYVGKTINFGLVYGMQAFKLSKELNITIKEAEILMNKIISGMPKFFYFKEQVEEFVIKNLYSRTMLGRIRFFDEKLIFRDNKDHDRYINSLKKEGFNTVIQGTAADMLKLAFVYVFERNPYKEKLKVILLIHDEIVLECHKDIADDAKVFVEDCMREAFEYFVTVVPIKIDAKIKDAWSK